MIDGKMAALAALVLVTACGSKDAKTTTVVAPGVTVTSTNGDNGTQTATFTNSVDGKDVATTIATSTDGKGLAVPTDLPAWAPAYPGSKVVTSINGTSGAGTGKVLAMQTGDAVAKVMSFYDQKLAAAGVKPAMSTDQSDSSMRMIPAEGSGKGTLLVVTKADSGSGSQIMMTYGAK